VATTQTLPNILTDNILANCQISMSLEQLLALVPRFCNHLERVFYPSVNEESKPTIQFVKLTSRTNPKPTPIVSPLDEELRLGRG
jgi:hypothetical protein